MSFDMTEKLIHSIGLDDDSTKMMREIDIKNENIMEMTEETEEMNERGKAGQGNYGNLKRVLTKTDEKVTEEEMNLLESTRTQDSGCVPLSLLLHSATF